MLFKSQMLCFSLVLSAGAACSQDLPSISTDRPDQTESPFLVPGNNFQMEAGFNYERPDEGEENLVLPTILWRKSLNPNFELRAVTELNSYKPEGGDAVTGLLPVQAGVKIHIAEASGLIPQTAFIGHLGFPEAASDDFKSLFIAPSFRFTMQHALSDQLNLSYNLGMEWDGFSAEGSGLYTLAAGYTLTDKIGMYIELFGFMPEESKSRHNADGGFTYLLQNNMQLDLSCGTGLGEGMPDKYVSLGFSVRLPD